MYIRRKVFSLMQDEVTGEERYFSTTEFELENDLDERYFSDGEDKKGLSGVQKAAIASAALTGAIIGGKYLGKKISSKALDAQSRIANASAKGQLSYESIASLEKEANRNLKIGDTLQKPADVITGAYKKARAKIYDVERKRKKAAAHKKNWEK